MKGPLLALAGLGAVGLIALSASSSKDPLIEYQEFKESGKIDKDTDLLLLANKLLDSGHLEESKELREIHTRVYSPYMSEEDIKKQIADWKNHVSELYGVTWEQ